MTLDAEMSLGWDDIVFGQVIKKGSRGSPLSTALRLLELQDVVFQDSADNGKVSCFGIGITRSYIVTAQVIIGKAAISIIIRRLDFIPYAGIATQILGVTQSNSRRICIGFIGSSVTRNVRMRCQLASRLRY